MFVPLHAVPLCDPSADPWELIHCSPDRYIGIGCSASHVEQSWLQRPLCGLNNNRRKDVCHFVAREVTFKNKHRNKVCTREPHFLFSCPTNATIGSDRYALPVIQLDSLFWTVLLRVNTVKAQAVRREEKNCRFIIANNQLEMRHTLFSEAVTRKYLY